MLVRVESVDNIFPSLESLSELGLGYKTNSDGSVIVELNESECKITENEAMSYLLSSNEGFENTDPSLLYFVIQKNRIILSGDFVKVSDNDYMCTGPLRSFSKINVPVISYASASQNDVSELEYLNGQMLDATAKEKNMTM